MADPWALSSSDGECAPLPLPATSSATLAARLAARGPPNPKGRPRKRPAAAKVAPSEVAEAEAMVTATAEPGLLGFLRSDIGSGAQRAVAKCVLRKHIPESPEIKRFRNWALGPQPRPLCPKNTEAILLDMPVKTVRRLATDTAIAVHFGSRAFVSALVSHIMAQINQHQLQPIAVITHVAYDETPMVMAAATRDHTDARQDVESATLRVILATASASGLRAAAEAAAAATVASGIGAAATAAAAASAAYPGVTAKKTPKTCKIMNTELHLGILCRSSGGRHILLCTPVTCPLQTLQSTTADLIVAHLKEVWQVPLLSHCRRNFPVNIDLSTADRASSNIKAEGYLNKESSNVWRLSVPCSIHMVHTVQERAFDVVSSILSGAIALARAQKQLGAFDIFRDLLTEVLRTSVRLVKAWPPEDSPRIQHRNALLDLLLAGNLTDQRRKVRLQHLLTGDLASASIEWHVGPGSAPDIAMWAKEVAELLAPYPTPILQRHRWVNSFPSLDSVALLANTHQLLKRVVPQWVGRLQNGKPGDLSDDSGDEAIAERDMPRAPDGQPDWKSWNEHQRSDAGKLAKGPYDGAMVVARITMQCQIRLLHALEERASHTWMNRVLQGWMGMGPQTRCRIVEAATQPATRPYFQSLHNLMFQDDPWQALAGHQRTQRETSLAFALLARAACAVYQLIHQPYRGFPYKLFALLVADGAHKLKLIRDIQDARPCLLDSFSSNFLRRYRNQLDSDECFAILQSIAVLQVVSLFSDIEIGTINIRCFTSQQNMR